MTFASTMRAALIAGIVAAALAAGFHLVLTEPVIDQAIALEEQLQGAGAEHEEPLVSRSAQRVGLVVGLLLYGLTWATIMGAVYHLGSRWIPAGGTAARGLALGLLAYWAVALLPFLKYPANPPGVGDPGTIAVRQGLYAGLLLISAVATALAIALAHHVARRTGSSWRGCAAGAATLGLVSLAACLALPPNPDAVRMPDEVVSSFRALSLAGLTLFWLLLTAGFALIVRATGTGDLPLATSH